MPKVEVRRGEKLITIKEDTKSFCIAFAYYTLELIPPIPLMWRTGKMPDWETDDDSVTPEMLDGSKYKEPSTRLIGGKGVEEHFGAKYVFDRIWPDWLMKINDIGCQKGFYAHLLIKCAKVELIFRDYRFIFFFSEEEIGIFDTELPVP